MLKPICVIQARDLDDAWFQALDSCFLKDEKNDYIYSQRYRIDRGSYAGQERLEIDTAIIDIKYPSSGPLVPQMPPGKEYLAPTTKKVAEEYAMSLLDSRVCANQTYTYGNRIFNQLKHIIDMYVKNGYNTNQAILEIGQPSDVLLNDPPCLRLIDTRIRNNTLHFIVYFRSWDLYNGFPVNLAGLQILKNYVASIIGVYDGSIRAISKGLHIYDDMWKFAKERIGKND